MPWVVTTPLAYIIELPPDPFTVETGKTPLLFRYATDGKTCWILASNGPDGDADVNVILFPAPQVANGKPEIFRARFGDLLYDPSNGIASNGDLVWTEPGGRAP